MGRFIGRVGIFLACILFVAAFWAVSICYADDACTIAGENNPLICGTPDSDEETALQTKIKSVLETIFLWIGIISVIVIVIGGIKYMTSTGDAAKIKSAKSTIMYAVIGLIVTLAAFAITEFVIGALNGKAPEGGGTHAETGGGGGGESEEERVAVKGVRLTLPSLTMVIGETGKAKAKLIPDYAKDKTISFSSSRPSVATIDEKGNIKAIAEGSTEIRATAGNGKFAAEILKVVKPIEPESVTIAGGDITIAVGSSRTLRATVSPNNAKDKSVTWSSDKSDVATIDEKGRLTAKKVGATKITAKTSNGKIGTITVTVTEKGSSSNPGGGKSDNDNSSGGDIGDTKSRHKIGSALAVMHAANNGNINKVIEAGKKKYYAVECDVYISGGTIYCAHDKKYFSKSSATLDKTMSVAKQYGMVVILDHITSSRRDAVAKYIKKNEISERVFVQLYDYNGNAEGVISTMKSMNSTVGKKLHYMGCHMLNMSAAGYSSKASTLKGLGMSAVNVQLGKDDAMKKIKKAGFDLGIFTWGSFSKSNISKYNAAPYNAKYMMTNDVSAN